eukprot:scpid98008/ scgid5947/ N-acetylgalactosamine-6-sulfatase; Chondroitinsulfatase; Galactose-6-sulfate sulfatase; N-acetylgalactosamine-6-sulfate sulfatase
MKMHVVLISVVALAVTTTAAASTTSDCSSTTGRCSASTGHGSKLHSTESFERRRVQLPEKPNIIIVYGDDVGYGDLNGYGHPTSSTPNLDRMISEGMRLTQFYSAAPVCSPSRASLMTGRLYPRTGVYSGKPGTFNSTGKQMTVLAVIV